MRDDYLELSKDLYTQVALDEDAMSTLNERYINTEINDIIYKKMILNYKKRMNQSFSKKLS